MILKITVHDTSWNNTLVEFINTLINFGNFRYVYESDKLQEIKNIIKTTDLETLKTNDDNHILNIMTDFINNENTLREIIYSRFGNTDEYKQSLKNEIDTYICNKLTFEEYYNEFINSTYIKNNLVLSNYSLAYITNIFYYYICDKVINHTISVNSGIYLLQSFNIEVVESYLEKDEDNCIFYIFTTHEKFIIN